MGRLLWTAAVVACLGLSGAAKAQEIVGSYAAYIGEDDLYNSQGVRLTAPWQVLRQDRANYHKFHIRQRGDEGDPFFSDVNNRAAMEQMVMNGSIDRDAARDLLRGGATVYVTIYGHNGRGDYVNVTVVR
jgi:hypothetical protein